MTPNEDSYNDEAYDTWRDNELQDQLINSNGDKKITEQGGQTSQAKS